MVTSPSKVKQNQKDKEEQPIAYRMDKRLYTLKEGAYYLGLSVWSMRELIWAGEIPVVRRDGGRKIYLDKYDLDRHIEKNKSTYV
jgi:excisionase family DNA binding protein